MSQNDLYSEQYAQFAAGSAAEPIAMMIAAQMRLSAVARREVRGWEHVGGAMLEDIVTEPVGEDLLAATLARIESPQPVDDVMPAPLPDEVLACLEGDIDALDWSRMTNGLSKIVLLDSRDDFETRLLRIAAGKRMPYHTHEGSEFTLVLQGGFADSAGHYVAGDVAVATAEIEHAPIADTDGDCICLAVTDGPLRLTRGVGRWLNWAVRY